MKKQLLLPYSLFILFILCLSRKSLSQNVGIATSNPQATLDIKGNQRVGGSGKFMSYDSVSGNIIWNNSKLFVAGSQYLMQHSASAEGLYYGNGQVEYRDHTGDPIFYTNWGTGDGYFKGNVGIGTVSPQAKLHLASGSNEVIRMDAYQPFISLYSSGAYQGYLWRSPNSIEVGSASGTNLPITLAPNGVQTLFVSPSGNVGINSNIPYRRLDIVGADTTRMMIASTSGFGATGIEMVSDYGTSSTWRPGYLLSGDNGNFTGRLDFFTNGSGIENKLGSQRAMSIVEGKLGIGTTAPAARLHISGANEALRLEANNPFLSLYSDGNYKGYLWYHPGGIELGSAAGTGQPVILAPDGSPKVYFNANGSVGIGTASPNAPLGFPATLGKKITLYPGASGDAGFGISGNRLQIYADNPNADVAIGYDAAGVFQERFAVKANGAISFNGSMGDYGFVLQSTGSAGAPVWASPTNTLAQSVVQLSGTGGDIPLPGANTIEIPGLVKTYFTLNGLVLSVNYNIEINSIFCPGCLPSQVFVELVVNGGVVKAFPYSVPNSGFLSCTGNYLLSLASGGSATIKLRLTYTGVAPGVIVYPTRSYLGFVPYYF